MQQAMSCSLKFFEKIKRGIHEMATPDIPMSNNLKEDPQKDILEDFNIDNSIHQGCEAVKSEILPYYVGYLPDCLLEEAKFKLHETEETKQFCLRELRSLVEKEENLVCRTDDAFLLQYLRARKFNLKRSFKLLQNYFLFRKEYSHVYDDIDTDKIQKLLFHNFAGFLEYRDNNGSVVVVIKLEMWDPDVYSFQEFFTAMTGCLVHAIQDPATQVAGFRIIMDTRGLSWKHLRVLTPHSYLLLIRATQYCFPGRYRGFHVFSENKLFNIAWAIIYPFLTTKLKKRIFHHGTDFSCLQEYISPEILPEEFGGKLGPYDNSGWADIINDDKEKMMDMLRYGYVS